MTDQRPVRAVRLGDVIEQHVRGPMSSPERARCIAIGRLGWRCGRYTLHPSRRCWQHRQH